MPSKQADSNEVKLLKEKLEALKTKVDEQKSKINLLETENH